MSYREQHDLYRDFKVYVERELSREFPEISICAFDDMEVTMNAMKLPMVNVGELDDPVDFIRRVQAFRRGTEVKPKRGVKTGKMSWTAYVPLDDPDAPPPRRRDASSSSSTTIAVGSPNPMRLVGWNAVLLALIAVAWRTTQWEEWVQLGRIFGV